MNCLVSGAAGFIGSALVKRLIKEGHHVTGLIHHVKPNFNHRHICYIKGDISDGTSLNNLAKDFDIIFHCAGLVNEYSNKNKYYKVHIKGTENLVQFCKKFQCKKFVFLSHIPYELTKKKYHYQKTKAIAESYLISEYKNNHFPVCIIRPGNVYGPNAKTWVVRPLQAIKTNRIALINKGKGIFLHTYIENLIDALLLTMQTSSCIGEIIDITDGDNTVTWGTYLNDLSNILGKKSISRNISKPIALLIGKVMMVIHSIFGIMPLITPYAVEIFSNKKSVSIEKAYNLLNYQPRINYQDGMKLVRKWVNQEGYHFF